MYSDKISPEEDYEVMKIYVDGALLKGKDFSSQEWDRLYLSLQRYLDKDSVNDDMITVKNRLLRKLHAGRFENLNAAFSGTIPATGFQHWYKELVESLTREDAHNISIYKYKYKWDGNQLKMSDSTMLMNISR